MEYKLRLIEAGKRMLEKQLTVETWGNLSLRNPETGRVYLTPSAMAYHTIAPAIEAIHRSYDQKLTSEELAQKCKLTHSYFCRLFKRVMGVTPIEYQTQNRLRLADVFLSEGTHTVADIAHMVGFDDAAYFSRCYKKYRGFPPRRAQDQ